MDPRLAALDILRDEDGRPMPGYQVGRAAAILDWQRRREQEETLRMVSSLRSARWRRNNLAFARSLARIAARDRSLAAAAPCRCEECGAEWLPIDGRRRSRFCSHGCANRWHGPRRNRNRGLRQRDARTRILSALSDHPGSTARELAGHAGTLPGSTSSMLVAMVKDGSVIRSGTVRRPTYSIGVSP